MSIRIGCLALVALAFASGDVAHAYEIDTHHVLTDRALSLSEAQVGAALAVAFDDTSLATEVATPWGSRDLRSWLIQGAEEEDTLGYELRTVNHFHDPTQPLLSAGLESVGLLPVPGVSSITWAFAARGSQQASIITPSNVSIYYGMSWFDARQDYWLALTSPDPVVRRRYLALAMKAQGAVMHLIQDASVPSHTRNDPHVPFLGDSDAFHGWVNDPRNAHRWATAFMNPVRPSDALLRQGRSDPYPPLANLIDADRYDPASSNSAAVLNEMWTSEPMFGVAEFSNGNFFTDDRMDEAYEQPPLLCSQLDPFMVAPYSITSAQCRYGGDLRGVRSIAPAMWHFLERSGQRVVPDLAYRRLVTYVGLISGLSTDVMPPTLEGDPTGMVFETYARALIPYAIGYSAEVPRYFFRGDINIEPVTEDPSSTDPDQPGEKITITNPLDEEMQGDFGLYYDATDGSRKPMPVGTPWSDVTLGQGASRELIVPPTPCDAAEPGKYLLTFRGRLGLESDAVFGRIFRMPSRLVFCKAGVGTGVVQVFSGTEVVAEKVIDGTSNCRDIVVDGEGTFDVSFSPDPGSYVVRQQTNPYDCNFPSSCPIDLDFGLCSGVWVGVGHTPAASVDITVGWRECEERGPCAFDPSFICGACDGPFHPSDVDASVVQAEIISWDRPRFWFDPGSVLDVTNEETVVGPSSSTFHFDAPYPAAPVGTDYLIKVDRWCDSDYTVPVVRVRGVMRGVPIDEEWYAPFFYSCSSGTSERYFHFNPQIDDGQAAMGTYWSSSCDYCKFF